MMPQLMVQFENVAEEEGRQVLNEIDFRCWVQFRNFGINITL